jgi:hypothetical protein
MHIFIVANPGDRTTVTRDLRLESAHFTRQSASSRLRLLNICRGDAALAGAGAL